MIKNKTILNKFNAIAILPHTMPDGDTIGSSVALFLGLKQLGHKAYIIIDDQIPDEIKCISDGHITSVDEAKNTGLTFDLCISVDMSDNERLRERQFFADTAELWNIDHHQTNTYFGDLTLVDTTASATGEIIFGLLHAWGVTLTSEIAEALYVAIVTDTGSFKYQNTTATTHRIVADLLEVGIDTEKISRSLYHNEPQSKIQLHAVCMQDLAFYQNGKVAVAVVSQALLKAHSANMLETDGLVEKIRDIRGVEMVVLLKEINDSEIKISMRSIGAVDVSSVAQSFGGGGHKNAAGFSVKGSLQLAIDTVVNEVVEKVIL